MFEVLNAVGGTEHSIATAVTAGTWHFGCVTWASSSMYLYLDGKQSNSNAYGTTDALDWSAMFYIGNRGTGFQAWLGQIANVQIYNTSLSASEIQALYLEGIGGAPFELQNLVGWYPLNGNANDYSGNGNNGQAIGGVTYTNSWTSGYTTP